MTLELSIVCRRGEFTLEVDNELAEPVVAVFGASGSGKTTLLHSIAGLCKPQRGRIKLFDEVLLDTDAGIDLPPDRRGLGIVFQDGRLFPHLSVAGNLKYGRGSGRRVSAPVPFDQVVELLDLGPLLRRRPGGLSGGERQRVALGRALLSGPRMLLLDEPLTALDQALKQQVIPFLQRVRDTLHVPMLYVSHDLREVLQISDQLLLLSKGVVLGSGRYADLAQEDAALTVLAGHQLVNIIQLDASETGGEGRRGLAGADADVAHARPRAGLHLPAAPATPLTVAIGASDIALAPQAVSGISIQNQFPGRVTRLSEHLGRVVVEIDVGQPLLALVTPRAVQELPIRCGQPIWCLIKSSAVQVLGESQRPRRSPRHPG